MNSKNVFFDRNMVLLSPEDTLENAVRALKQTKLNMLPVVNSAGELMGVFTRTNLYNALLNKASLTSIIEPWIVKVVSAYKQICR